jgi:hypothetical protein
MNKLILSRINTGNDFFLYSNGARVGTFCSNLEKYFWKFVDADKAVGRWKAPGVDFINNL